MSDTRTILAALLAPAVPGIIALFEYGDIESGGSASLFILLIAFPVSYGASAMFGLPMVAYLRNKRRLNVITVVVCGSILGAIVFYLFGFILAALLGSSRDLLPAFDELMYGAALGVLVALPFALIAGYPLTGSAQERDTME